MSFRSLRIVDILLNIFLYALIHIYMKHQRLVLNYVSTFRPVSDTNSQSSTCECSATGYYITKCWYLRALRYLPCCCFFILPLVVTSLFADTHFLINYHILLMMLSYLLLSQIRKKIERIFISCTFKISCSFSY